MALGIEAYRAASASGMSQLALVRDSSGNTRIGNASETGVGFLKRLFNTDASQRLNRQVMSDFKASMVRAYGAKIAEAAFSEVIGSKGLSGAKLSSLAVSQTLTAADELMKARLRAPVAAQGTVSLRINGASGTFLTFDDFDRSTLLAAQKAFDNLNDLLMEMPTDTMSLQDFTARINQAKSDAEDLVRKDLPEINGTEKIIAALQRCIDLVNGKIAEATEVCNGNPITYNALADFVGKHVDSAISALEKLPNGGDEFAKGDAAKTALRTALLKLADDNGPLRLLADAARPSSFLSAEHPYMNAPRETEELVAEIRKVLPAIASGTRDDAVCPDPQAFVGKAFEEKLAAFCAAVVKNELNRHSPPLGDSFKNDAFETALSQGILREFSDTLNRGNWSPIEKNVTFSLDGATYRGKSTITPASHMGGAMGPLYAHGPRGYNSHSYGETTHAVNLAHSTFEVAGKTVFSGIRHGVHAAVDVEDPTQFRDANRSRAKETLIAAFTSNNALVQAALNDPNTPVKFYFSSVSLLTPDFFRGNRSNRHENELLMLRAQTEAYRWFSNKVIEVDVPVSPTVTRRVKIRPEIATFNYGVNWGGVSGFSRVFGGWGPSQDVNFGGLTKLTSFVQNTLDSIAQEKARITGESDAEKAARQALTKREEAIKTLWKQIKAIDGSKSYASDGHEAYKMTARIAVLTHLLGGVPAWNCKSGKDRTGMMDVECKFLATLVAQGQTIPEPGAPLSAEQRILFRSLLLQSGNHEMQRYNTGIAGYKLEGVGSIKERIGDIDAHAVFLGGSKIVRG